MALMLLGVFSSLMLVTNLTTSFASGIGPGTSCAKVGSKTVSIGVALVCQINHGKPRWTVALNQKRKSPSPKLSPIGTTTNSSSTPEPRAVWQPNVLDTFHLQLSGVLAINVTANIYDIDLFDTSPEQIAQLKQKGHKVVCYFSAGSSENWRPDFAQFLMADMGNPLEGWSGEKWLDTRSDSVRKLMRARLDLASSKGCDGVDPDNVNGYTNSTGFPLTADNQFDYDRFLSVQAHSRGLAIGLKNDVTQLSALATSFDFAVNEQCHEFDECTGYRAFTSKGKPVLNVEYQKRFVDNIDGAFVALCVRARAENLHTLVLPLLLDGSFRLSCD